MAETTGPTPPMARLKRKLRELLERRDHYIKLPFEHATRNGAGLPKLAVMLHCYYVDELQLHLQHLENIPIPFDLLITTDCAEKKTIISRMATASRAARVEVFICENRGRDIAPRFVHMRAHYRAYDLVLHIHTKKSPHKNLSGWCSACLNDLLGSEATVRSILALFDGCKTLGVIAPRYYPPIRDAVSAHLDLFHCEAIGRKLGIRFRRAAAIDFPAGSFFWARTAALQPILDLDLKTEDFEAEAGQLFGTFAHAIERMIFISSELAGLGWCFVGQPEMTSRRQRQIMITEDVSVAAAIARCSRRLVMAMIPARVLGRHIRQEVYGKNFGTLPNRPNGEAR